MKSTLVLPPDVKPSNVVLQKTGDNSLMAIIDSQVYYGVRGETLGTVALYYYDAFGQLQLEGLVQSQIYCWPCELDK